MRLLTLFLLTGMLLFADNHGDEYREHHLPMDMRYLDLSPEQHNQVKIIIKHFRHEHKAFHQEEVALHRDMITLFTAETFDEAALLQRTTELKRRSAEIQARFFSRMHKVLTPLQRARFVNFMEEWDVE